MEYILIILLQLLGIGFHVMQKISAIDKRHPEKSIREVREIFFEEDWNTLAISGLIIMLNLVTQFIVEQYAPLIKSSISYYELKSFAIALLLGYGGQRMIYKLFGSAENFISKRIEQKVDIDVARR